MGGDPKLINAAFMRDECARKRLAARGPRSTSLARDGAEDDVPPARVPLAFGAGRPACGKTIGTVRGIRVFLSAGKLICREGLSSEFRRDGRSHLTR
jgi:hypothetical protein